jgi:hypothetical protein
MRTALQEKELRDFLRASGSPRRKRGWHWLDEATVAAYADGRLDPGVRRKTEAHLAKCSGCRDQVRFLVQLAAAEEQPEVPTHLLTRAEKLAAERPSPSYFAVRTWRWSAATAAVAALILAATITLHEPGRVLNPAAPPPPRTKESLVPSAPVASAPSKTPTSESRSAPGKTAPLEIVWPPEDTIASARQIEFRWTPVAGSVTYEVQVLRADGTLEWEGRSETTRLTLLTDRLPRKGKYYVWVRAQLPDGRTVKSHAVSFQVSPER